MTDSAKKDSARRAEVRTITYLAPGVAPDNSPGTPTIDPALEKIREREAKALAEVKIDTARSEPTIDPELVKIRDAEIKRATERARATEPAPEKSTASEPAKKAAPKKSSK